MKKRSLLLALFMSVGIVSIIQMSSCSTNGVEEKTEKNSSQKNNTAKKNGNLMDVSLFEKLEKGMSEKEVHSLVGPPARNAGSGIAYTVYNLKSGDSLWIAWRNGKTIWAFIKKNGGETESIFE